MADEKKFSDCVREGMEPPEVFRACANLAREMRKWVGDEPRQAEKILQGAWLLIDKMCQAYIQHPNTPMPNVEDLAATIFMREYFNHMGNWQGMERCMLNASQRVEAARSGNHVVLVHVK